MTLKEQLEVRSKLVNKYQMMILPNKFLKNLKLNFISLIAKFTRMPIIQDAFCNFNILVHLKVKSALPCIIFAFNLNHICFCKPIAKICVKV